MADKITLVDALNQWLGGAGTTLVGAALGRLMFHTVETRKMRRRFFGKELLWEIPIALGMAIIGEGIADYFQLGQTATTGIVAALSYLGPRGSEVLLARRFMKKMEGKD